MQVLSHADAYLCFKQADYTSKLMFAVDIPVVNKSTVLSNNALVTTPVPSTTPPS